MGKCHAACIGLNARLRACLTSASIGSPPPRASVAPSGLGQRLARLEGWIERDRVGLTAADLTPAQVEAITDAVRQAADHGDHVTPDQLTAGFTAIRAELAPMDNWFR